MRLGRRYQMQHQPYDKRPCGEADGQDGDHGSYGAGPRVSSARTPATRSSGSGLPPVLAGAAIGAGATIAASWTQADVTVLGWYLCQRGNQAACAASGAKAAPAAGSKP